MRNITPKDIQVFIDELFCDDRNSYYYVAVKRNDVMSSQAYAKKDLYNAIVQMEEADHVYISVNGYTDRCGRRIAENIRQINGIFCDVDCHAASGQDLANKINRGIEELKLAIERKMIAAPTMIVHTGRGLHIYYMYAKSIPVKIADGALFSRGLRAHANLQNTIYQSLSVVFASTALEVDSACKDVTRLVRVAGTRNAHTGAEASIVYNSQKRYSFAELREYPVLEKDD